MKLDKMTTLEEYSRDHPGSTCCLCGRGGQKRSDATAEMVARKCYARFKIEMKLRQKLTVNLYLAQHLKVMISKEHRYLNSELDSGIVERHKVKVERSF